MATTANDPQLERAREVLRRAPLIDGHNDLLWELRKRVALRPRRSSTSPEPQPELMTDLRRLREGAVGGQFWSVYVPSDLPGDTAVTATLEQIDGLRALVAHTPTRSSSRERPTTSSASPRRAASRR